MGLITALVTLYRGDTPASTLVLSSDQASDETVEITAYGVDKSALEASARTMLSQVPAATVAQPNGAPAATSSVRNG